MKFSEQNFKIGKSVILGRNVQIGDGCVIFDNVEIGNNTIIADNCIIGEPLQDYYYNSDYINPKTVIGEGSLIRSNSIIYSDCTIGSNFSTGHRITIREGSIIGNNCRIGTLCDLQGDLEIGDYCWLHSNVHVGKKSKIGNYVFIYPYVIFTNDPTPPSNICKGPTVGDYTQIAVSSVLLPGIEIGKHCLIGAGSVVGKNYGDYQLILGSPAKNIKDVRDIKSRDTGESHYPWPYNFDRNMPWENINYDEWLNGKISRS